MPGIGHEAPANDGRTLGDVTRPDLESGRFGGDRNRPATEERVNKCGIASALVWERVVDQCKDETDQPALPTRIGWQSVEYARRNTCHGLWSPYARCMTSPPSLTKSWPTVRASDFSSAEDRAPTQVTQRMPEVFSFSRTCCNSDKGTVLGSPENCPLIASRDVAWSGAAEQVPGSVGRGNRLQKRIRRSVTV